MAALLLPPAPPLAVLTVLVLVLPPPLPDEPPDEVFPIVLVPPVVVAGPLVVFVVPALPPAPSTLPPHTHSVHSPSRQIRVPSQPVAAVQLELSVSWHTSGLLVEWDEQAPSTHKSEKAATVTDRREDIGPQSIETSYCSQSSTEPPFKESRELIARKLSRISDYLRSSSTFVPNKFSFM